MIIAWREFLTSRYNKSLVALSFLAMALVLLLFASFLSWNESRNGYRFNDPVLNAFRPLDISLITFILTYLTGFTGLLIAVPKPELFLRFIQAYILLTLMRIVTIYFIPLDPPESIIPLKDIFLRTSFYSGRDNVRDLFFSGHTATIFLFAFGFKKQILKFSFALGAVLIAALLVLQHVHFSIDVIFAPFFAWLALWIQQRIFPESKSLYLPHPQK
ncbi:MAG: sphingomyelin synthase family protein [Bacteroidota bacterium]|nr:sphingomyelin synthase family protein [Bacteroidota bacterium]